MGTKIDVTDIFRERYEKRLRKVLKIGKHLRYNRNLDLGPIGSWILTSIKGVAEAKRLLVDKAVAIFIHEKHGSAVFFWDVDENTFQCELWSNSQLIDKQDGSIELIDKYMRLYWRFCKYKKNEL